VYAVPRPQSTQNAELVRAGRAHLVRRLRAALAEPRVEHDELLAEADADEPPAGGGVDPGRDARPQRELGADGGQHRGMAGAPPHDLVEEEPRRTGVRIGGQAEVAIHDRGEPVRPRERGEVAEAEQRAAVVVEALADAVAVDCAELRAQGEQEVDVGGADPGRKLVEGPLARLVQHVRQP
jgi:hypothetical protein